MTALGSELPAFSLPDVRTGQVIPFPQTAGKPILVMFICRHCPFVVHVKGELARIGRDCASTVEIAAISSNDVTYKADDSPERLKQMAEASGFLFPLFYDESQDIARSFGAACTPEFFLFDAERRLAYRGQLDGSRPGNGVPVDGRDLRAAMDALLRGGRPSEQQRPSAGCNIKWKRK